MSQRVVQFARDALAFAVAASALPGPDLAPLRDRLVAMTLAEPSAHPGGDRD